MLALLSLGRLAECKAFEQADVRPGDLRGLVISNDYQLSCYRDVAVSLRQKGRADLSSVIDRAIGAYVNPITRRAVALSRSTSAIVQRVAHTIARARQPASK